VPDNSIAVFRDYYMDEYAKLFHTLMFLRKFLKISLKCIEHLEGVTLTIEIPVPIGTVVSAEACLAATKLEYLFMPFA
jgi:hypothetical protein